MATQKVVTIDDDDLWQAIAKYVFWAGIPRDPETIGNPFFDSRFSAGYPDRYIEDYTLEWDTDFTQEQHDEWGRVMKAMKRRATHMKTEESDPYIAVLKQWRSRDPAQTTDAHRDATIDAMVELWRLELKEED